MYQAGVPEAEIEKQMDELRAKVHDQAVRDIKLFFILEKIAEDRDINVSEEQVNGAIAQIAQQSNKRFDRVRDDLSKGDGLATLYYQLRDQQVLDALLTEAKITEIEGPKKKRPTTTTKEKTSPKKTTVKKASVKKTTAKKASPKKTTKKKTGKKTS